MKRRNFIKNSACTTLAGVVAIKGLDRQGHSGELNETVPLAALAGRQANRSWSNQPLPVTTVDLTHRQVTRLVVKPIMTNMYHTAEWCGPCRFDITTPEEEKRGAIQSFESFRKELAGNTAGIDLTDIELLEPSLVLFVEDFKITDEAYSMIEEDARKADVLLMSPAGSSIATFQIAKKYGKPVVFYWGLNCRTVDIAAYCRSNGVEAFIPDQDMTVNNLFTLLRARKVFSATRILYPTNWGWPSVASVAGINEPGKLKDLFGIQLERITYDELSGEMDRVRQDPQAVRTAEGRAGILYSGADHCYLDKQYVVSSMLFYQAVINLMTKHDCNAFTIECFEFCCSRLPEKWTITPCLIHTMFRDNGIPSACEGDLGALLAMQMLMAVSEKSPHMGNMFYRDNGTLEVNHSVPGIKMNGYDKPGLPYQLGKFVSCGWGTKVMVDFIQNDEKDVTVVRMNPTGTGLLVLKGKLTGSNGWGQDLLGCSVSAFIVGKESGSAHEFMKKQADYGNHLCWVYGDYTGQLKKLGDIMGVEVVVES